MSKLHIIAPNKKGGANEATEIAKYLKENPNISGIAKALMQRL